ncbi:hypothetical protein K502DRAFT_345603 [Neoconidiobolus thromboides FSU 785]|nr:hypothetical protein K502DRAFT_345603 [Neoconidiobolus thromboides FSU 785]
MSKLLHKGIIKHELLVRTKLRQIGVTKQEVNSKRLLSSVQKSTEILTDKEDVIKSKLEELKMILKKDSADENKRVNNLIEDLLKEQQPVPLNPKVNIIQLMLSSGVIQLLNRQYKNRETNFLEGILGKDTLFLKFEGDRNEIKHILAVFKDKEYQHKLLCKKIINDIHSEESYYAVIESSLEMDQLELVIEYLNEMIVDYTPNKKLVHQVFVRLLKSNKQDVAMDLYLKLKEKEYKFNKGTYISFITYFSRYKDKKQLNNVLHFFNEMTIRGLEPNITLFNIMLKNYHQLILINKDKVSNKYYLTKIQQIVQQMKETYVGIDDYSYAILLSIFRILLKLDKEYYLKEFNLLINIKEIKLNVQGYNELLKIYASLKEVESMEEVILTLCEKNLLDRIVLDTIIEKFSELERYDKVEYYYLQLTKKKKLNKLYKFQIVQPDQLISLKMIKVFAKLNKPALVQEYYYQIEIRNKNELNMVLLGYLELLNKNSISSEEVLWKIETIFDAHPEFKDMVNYKVLIRCYYIYILRNNKDKDIMPIWKKLWSTVDSIKFQDPDIVTFLLKSMVLANLQDNSYLRQLLNEAIPFNLEHYMLMLQLAGKYNSKIDIQLIEERYKNEMPTIHLEFYNLYLQLMIRYDLPYFIDKVMYLYYKKIEFNEHLFNIYLDYFIRNKPDFDAFSNHLQFFILTMNRFNTRLDSKLVYKLSQITRRYTSQQQLEVIDSLFRIKKKDNKDIIIIIKKMILGNQLLEADRLFSILDHYFSNKDSKVAIKIIHLIQTKYPELQQTHKESKFYQSFYAFKVKWDGK